MFALYKNNLNKLLRDNFRSWLLVSKIVDMKVANLLFPLSLKQIFNGEI